MLIPKMAYVMPLRVRLQFTTNALPSLITHASREHEVIIVLDKCPAEYEFTRRKAMYPVTDITSLVRDDRLGREKVYRWIDSHKALLDEHHVKILEFHGDERCWTGGLRAAGAMNAGVRAASSDWVLAFGDEDCVFTKGWDVAMWEAIRGRDPMKYVSTPVMVMPRVHEEGFPSPPDAAWIHAQRQRCCHQLTYPLAREFGELSSGRIPLDAFMRFAATARLDGTHEESCGERQMCHWVPLLMHKSLFWSVGGYPVTDAAACSFDLVLDDALRERGVKKRMPLDHFILHAKHFAFLSEEIDRAWGDPELLATIQKRMIP